MNPDVAYRLHTDWARAANQPDTPHGQWLEDRVTHHAQPLVPGGVAAEGMFRVLGERWTFDGLLRSGPTQEANVVLAYVPHDDTADTAANVPLDVFPAAAPEPEPLSTTSTGVVVPTSVHLQAVRHGLASAPTYYVSPDMVAVLKVAAEALDDFDVMPRLPSSTGFVVLAEPIMLAMDAGLPQPVRAFAWSMWSEVSTRMGETGVAGEVWTFASRKKDTGFSMVQSAQKFWPSKTAWRNDPDLLPCFADIVVSGASMPPVAEPFAESQARERATDWLRTRGWALARGRDGQVTPEAWEAQVTAARARYDQMLSEERRKHGDVLVGNFQRYLAAFVLLLSQQITRPQAKAVPAGDAQLARKVAPSRPSEVTVVDLKPTGHRSSDEHGEHTRGPLMSRHLVGSHWKWQPYGPERALRRRIFVAGYVRGPEDAPLVVKPRVGRL